MSIRPKFLVGMVAAIGLTILFGMLLGNLSVPKSQKILEIQSKKIEVPIEPEVLRDFDTRLMVSIGRASHLPSILIEAQYAHEVGVREFILQSPLPSTDREKDRLRQAITGLLAISEDTTVSLALDCNPSQSWLRENPEEASTTTNDDLRYPSISSTKWKQITQSRLAELLNTCESDIKNHRVTGITLQALEGGRWMRTGGYDSSDAHKKDFRVWLKRRYENIEALNLSWANTSHESFDGIEHPTRINYDTATPSFFNIEDEMNRIDYHRFVDHAVLRFIAGLTSQIRAETDTAFEILAPAPGLLENTAPETGAWGRGALEAAGLDGTMTRLQSRHRQVGQHGYFASPTFQDTHTLSVDNTYTSIGYDTAANSIKVRGTYIPDHVYNLMAHNAILSAISGTTWVISDASGTGEFAHKPLWKKIDSILEIRHNILSTRTNDNTRLAVVLDGESPAYTQSPEIHRSIFDSLTDTLTHSGIAFTWLTLDSLLADPKPYAPVYLFPDLFQISSEKRERLHTLLAEQQATAIWLYAPGYIGETTDVANVTALTGITTKQREDGNSPLGSKFAFSGTWIEENQEFGSEKPTTLSFASTDELADPLARYQDDDSISIAMKHLEEGWTSIAIFEPHITHDLLRDIYYILEIPFDVSVLPATEDPVLYAGTDTLLLYSKTNSALSLELDNAQDVLNILDASQGWNNARTIPLELKAGTPALLSLR